jgi:hypothetical protein
MDGRDLSTVHCKPYKISLPIEKKKQKWAYKSIGMLLN